jgi:biopolymer transport protein TolQ
MTTDLTILGLLLRADIVVKATLLTLLLASLVSWAIIIDQSVRLAGSRRDVRRFGDAVRRGLSPQLWLAAGRRDGTAKETITAAVLKAGVAELQEGDRAGGLHEDWGQRRDRVERAMRLAMGEQARALEARLPFLATVGSVAPFIGLFGTVWGIMNSFQSIAVSKNTSLAVVAPGIAEALFATALGLVAAIPAVIAYNKLSTELGRYGNRLDAFAGEFSAILSRQIEERS